MGFGLGSACGAKLANPGRPVLLFTGDGCFRMNSSEMGTLVKYRIPILIIVFNNRSLGMVRQLQNLFYQGRYSETDLSAKPNFVKLAEAYGIAGRSATDRASFVKALAAAGEELAQGHAFLIDAQVHRDEKVLPMVPSGRPIDEQIL